jgi:hypothetical protein
VFLDDTIVVNLTLTANDIVPASNSQIFENIPFVNGAVKMVNNVTPTLARSKTGNEILYTYPGSTPAKGMRLKFKNASAKIVDNGPRTSTMQLNRVELGITIPAANTSKTISYCIQKISAETTDCDKHFSR